MQYSYKFKEIDFFESADFVINYHHNLSKSLCGRTNLGKRGLGGELDEMLPGKLAEIAVCNILNNHPKNYGKILLPDMQIYDDCEVGKKKDPDITKIIENHISRGPKEHIEIKRFSENDCWIGARKDQFDADKEGYMCYVSLEFDNDNSFKQNDITGAFLKKYLNFNKLKSEQIKNFSDLKDISSSIVYIFSFDLIKKYGHLFPKGSIIPETQFPEVANAINKNGRFRVGYNLKSYYNQKNHVDLAMKIENSQVIPPYGHWKLNGVFSIFENKQYNSLIHCYENTTMFNPLFGSFKLSAGKTFRFYFKNKLRKGKTKNNDDYWISKKRLDEIIQNNNDFNINNQLKQILTRI